jgi:hypothetical protein
VQASLSLQQRKRGRLIARVEHGGLEWAIGNAEVGRAELVGKLGWQMLGKFGGDEVLMLRLKQGTTTPL